MQSTPKLEPNITVNSPEENFNLPSNASYEENKSNMQNYQNYSDSFYVKIEKDNDGSVKGKKIVLKSPRVNEAELLKFLDGQHNKYLPEASKEVIDNINRMKDYKWNLGVLLNDKINNLNQRISEEKEKIRKKEKEKKSESKLYENKINYLKQLIKKEENEGYHDEKKTNLELQKKKSELMDKINKIEADKKNMKDNMIKKYYTMMELKQKLNNSINELYSIQQQIKSRKFALEQEKTKEPSEKPDPEQQKLLHLSQNIGECIAKNLLIQNYP